MKKLLLILSSLVILSGQNTLCSTPKSQVQLSAIKIAAIGHVACAVLSLPFVSYPVYKFTFSHLSLLAGNAPFWQGAAYASAIMVGLSATEGAISLYPILYKSCGCSHEFINSMCDVSSEAAGKLFSWAMLGGMVAVVAHIFS